MATSVPGGGFDWSVMIPVYEPSELLNETLQSVRVAVGRAEGSFQVEIVDDASPSGSKAAFADAAGMTVAYHRRDRNGGLAACWNECIARARGRLVHILHQDDIVLPDFYAEMERLAAATPEAGMLFCRTIFRTGDQASPQEAEQEHAGLVPDWLARIAGGQRIQCPSVVVRRDIYAQLGGYDPRLKFVIDWEMWVRIAASCKVAHLPLPLVEYRVHAQSETARLQSRGCITDDFVTGGRLISATLARPEHALNRRRAMSFLVWSSLVAAANAERSGNYRAARREAFSALRHWLFVMRPKQSMRHFALLLRVLLKPNKPSPT